MIIQNNIYIMMLNINQKIKMKKILQLFVDLPKKKIIIIMVLFQLF